MGCTLADLRGKRAGDGRTRRVLGTSRTQQRTRQQATQPRTPGRWTTTPANDVPTTTSGSRLTAYLSKKECSAFVPPNQLLGFRCSLPHSPLACCAPVTHITARCSCGPQPPTSILFRAQQLLSTRAHATNECCWATTMYTHDGRFRLAIVLSFTESTKL